AGVTARVVRPRSSGLGKATRRRDRPPPHGDALGFDGDALGFDDDLPDGAGDALGRGTYVPSVSEARMTRWTVGSRPVSRLRKRRTCPGIMSVVRRLGV